MLSPNGINILKGMRMKFPEESKWIGKQSRNKSINNYFQHLALFQIYIYIGVFYRSGVNVLFNFKLHFVFSEKAYIWYIYAFKIKLKKSNFDFIQVSYHNYPTNFKTTVWQVRKCMHGVTIMTPSSEFIWSLKMYRVTSYWSTFNEFHVSGVSV